MRNELEEQLYNFVYVLGKIERFGKMQFDGHKTILTKNPFTGMTTPIRFKDGGGVEAIYFCSKSTLIVNAQLNGNLIGDGHMWIPEDLSMKGFHIGDTIRVCGNVEIYQRGNGTFDYCVRADRIEHV